MQQKKGKKNNLAHDLLECMYCKQQVSVDISQPSDRSKIYKCMDNACKDLICFECILADYVNNKIFQKTI
jgi:hypothetical protein